jgi:hypothetical protein
VTGNNSLLYCRIAVLPHWTHLPSHYPRSRSRFHCVTPLKRYKRWPRVCNAPRGRGWASAPRHRIPGSVSNLRPRRGARKSPHLPHPSLHGRGPHTGPRTEPRAEPASAPTRLHSVIPIPYLAYPVCAFSSGRARSSVLGVGPAPVPGTRSQVSDSRYPIPGTCLRKTRTRGLHTRWPGLQVPGTDNSVLGARFPVFRRGKRRKYAPTGSPFTREKFGCRVDGDSGSWISNA